MGCPKKLHFKSFFFFLEPLLTFFCVHFLNVYSTTELGIISLRSSHLLLLVRLVLYSRSQLFLLNGSIEESDLFCIDVLIVENECCATPQCFSSCLMEQYEIKAVCSQHFAEQTCWASDRECQNRLKVFLLFSSLFFTDSPVASLPLCRSYTLPTYLFCNFV